MSLKQTLKIIKGFFLCMINPHLILGVGTILIVFMSMNYLIINSVCDCGNELNYITSLRGQVSQCRERIININSLYDKSIHITELRRYLHHNCFVINTSDFNKSNFHYDKIKNILNIEHSLRWSKYKVGTFFGFDNFVIGCEIDEISVIYAQRDNRDYI